MSAIDPAGAPRAPLSVVQCLGGRRARTPTPTLPVPKLRPVDFPVDLDRLLRLPRHPDWKYELIDGRALLSHRPKPLAFVRSTDRPVAHAGDPIRARPIGHLERPPVEALLRDVWATEDPYRSFEQSLRAAELDRQIERSAAHRCFGVFDAGRVRACAVVQPSAPPTLTWLTVAREARGAGLATAVLAAVCADLRDRGEPLIASAASAANIASLRWHLSRGFALGPDPLRELRR